MANPKIELRDDGYYQIGWKTGRVIAGPFHTEYEVHRHAEAHLKWLSDSLDRIGRITEDWANGKPLPH